MDDTSFLLMGHEKERIIPTITKNSHLRCSYVWCRGEKKGKLCNNPVSFINRKLCPTHYFNEKTKQTKKTEK